LFGLGLLLYGIYLQVESAHFLSHSLRAQAVIDSVDDLPFLTSGTAPYPTTLTLHECVYVVTCSGEDKRERIARTKLLARTCAAKDDSICVLYNPKAPDGVLLDSPDMDVSSPGKLWIVFGVINLGLVYFMLVGFRKTASKGD
jgi:hypothetical protein